ncbi:MAG: nickel transporter [Methylotenera sp.]|nr:nickel transporter [Methylotenera sp.]
MQIIPVIDLLNGVVVHAKKGERQHYQPIQSQLTDSSAPLDIVAALLKLYPFMQLYIADLNAIQKTGNTHYKVIETIAKRFPQLTLWVDAGISNNTELSIWQQLNICLVIGSENFANIGNYCALNHQNKNFVLSLDFFTNGYQGPIELLTNTKYWPQNVIVMSLANVGAGQGVNGDLLSKIKARTPEHNVIAAGGIRGEEDLLQLKKMGIQGALMATALHYKKISTEQIESLAQ